ncbi:BsuPI-related putative proteinase inhibitor [Natrialba swarupiae]|uniref:Intracellular proteinase inhibitor BsuPI domain-containing protein n=1 Tax=Natrialba swarupiae TaxID=2448032 RepID=A0A5D5ANX3_9EURY|nr:BsuPI-related putative proteinase inhibitor [Natrialba swarupiae]TYT63386.1 hypothetical protein FYC77_02100 [Natrialba swarupiae]
MTLEGTLEVAVSRDERGERTVAFAFTVTNAGSDPLELQFPDAANAEFVVQDEGREVWRFTEGRAFAQVLGSERLGGGESTTYEGEWDDPIPGTYTAVAALRSREHDCKGRTEFDVPE